MQRIAQELTSEIEAEAVERACALRKVRRWALKWLTRTREGGPLRASWLRHVQGALAMALNVVDERLVSGSLTVGKAKADRFALELQAL